MKFGYCTGFATDIKDRIDYLLLDRIKQSGYDFVEFPLMLTSSISDAEFEQLRDYLAKTGLAATVTCNMFPPHIRLAGAEADRCKIAAYLDLSFERMARLGTKTVVLGSSGARDLPAGMSSEDGMSQLVSLLKDEVVPRLEKYGILLVMEPISALEANFITCLDDAMEVVERVASPSVALLADSVHMLRDGEDMRYLDKYTSNLKHIHVSELGRKLPIGEYSPGLREFLERLSSGGYDSTISFEPVACGEPDGMRNALELLKSMFPER